MTQETINLVIFDCDGVLVDSELISGRVLLAELRRCGLDLDFDHFSRHFVGRSFPTVARRIRDTSGVSLPADFEATYRARLLEAFISDLRPTPGIAELLEGLATPFCVATSSSPERTRRALSLTGLDGWFAGRVFTASEVPNGKPAPDLFLHAAAKMGVRPEECLVVEDSLPGIEAGLAASMRVLRYTGGAHLSGRPGSSPRGPLPVLPPSVRDFDRWSDFCAMARGLIQE